MGGRFSATVGCASPAVAGAGIGLINGAGNLGGTVGPYFFGYVRTMTGTFSSALLVGGLSLVVGSLIAVAVVAVPICVVANTRKAHPAPN